MLFRCTEILNNFTPAAVKQRVKLGRLNPIMRAIEHRAGARVSTKLFGPHFFKKKFTMLILHETRYNEAVQSESTAYKILKVSVERDIFEFMHPISKWSEL